VYKRIGSTVVSSVVAAATAAFLMVAPAHALPGWTINPNTGMPYNLPDTTRPPDQFSQYAPFSSYMFGSVILQPLVSRTGRIGTIAPSAFYPPTATYLPSPR
jgi:hypothetical protein